MSKESMISKIEQLSEDLEIKPAILVVGETYAHRTEIKAMGGRWDRELQGWFIPFENVANGSGTEHSDTPDPIAKEKPKPETKLKGRKLTRSQLKRGESIWNVELTKLGYGNGNWKAIEVILEAEIVAKSAQQVKVRTMKSIADWANEDNEGDSELATQKRKIKVAVELADSKWIEDKGDSGPGEVAERFQRRFGISEKYEVNVR